MRPRPGTDEFEQALITRLRKEVGKSENLEIYSRELYSRNTLIYRLAAGDQRFVAKVQLTSNSNVLANEFAMLKKLEGHLRGEVVSLTPVALFPELDALVTLEEKGVPLRWYIDEGILHKQPEVRNRVSALMRKAAHGLHRFHSEFKKKLNGQMKARLYLDFSPRNILIRDDGVLVLLDPPEYEEFGDVYHDLGVFCFDIARAAFMPNSILRFPMRWLNELKFTFLTSYMKCLGKPLAKFDLDQIRLAEEHRARNALGWYRTFYKYKNWPRELARYAYFSPLLHLYIRWHLRRSYEWIEERIAQ